MIISARAPLNKTDDAAQVFHLVLTVEARQPRRQLLIFRGIIASSKVMQTHVDHLACFQHKFTKDNRDTFLYVHILEHEDDAAAQVFHVVLTMEARRPRRQLLIFKNIITATNKVKPSTQIISHHFDIHSQL